MGNQIPMSFLTQIALEIPNNPDFSMAYLKQSRYEFYYEAESILFT